MVNAAWLLALPALTAASERFDPDVDSAVRRGLRYLESRQLESGGFSGDVGLKRRQGYLVSRSDAEHVGVTALAGMAFLAGGHLPGRGRYGRVVERVIDNLIGNTDEFGFIGANGSRMYSHAFATLFLAEAYGMARSERMLESLRRAVDLIVRAQNEEGAWRYQPFVASSDMSITVCQLMALRAARNGGLHVPKECIDRAVDYVRASLVRTEREAWFRRGSAGYYKSAPGAFRYQLFGDHRSSFALTAAGVTSLYHAAEYDTLDLEQSLLFLENQHESVSERWFGHYFYYYGHYYACQAMFISGSVRGHDYWATYWDRVSRELVERQAPDGSWENPVGPGPEFATAVACIVLQVPNRYLPILQR